MEYAPIIFTCIIALLYLYKDWCKEKEKKEEKNAQIMMCISIILAILTVAASLVSGWITYSNKKENRRLEQEVNFKDRRQLDLILLCGRALSIEEAAKKIEKHLGKHNNDLARALTEATLLYANTLGEAERNQLIRDITNCFIYRTENRKEKIKLLELINSSYPYEFSEVSRLLGELYAQESEFEKARDVLKGEISAHPDDVVAYHWLGRTYLKTGPWKEALKWYKKGVDDAGGYINLYIELGDVIWFYKKDLPGAMIYYKKAIESEDKNKKDDDWFEYYKQNLDGIRKMLLAENIACLKYEIKQEENIDFFSDSKQKPALKHSPFIIEFKK